MTDAVSRIHGEPRNQPDELRKAELTAYLEGVDRGCDLVISADTY